MLQVLANAIFGLGFVAYFINKIIKACLVTQSWSRGYKPFFHTQLSWARNLSSKRDILTLISMINTTSERLKARNFFICRYFSVYEQLKFRA